MYKCFSGAFLEDAMVVSCGHSFGGLMLRRVIDTVSRLSPDTRRHMRNAALIAL